MGLAIRKEYRQECLSSILTVLVMPSLNLIYSMGPSRCSQSGKRDRTSRSAEACESAVLCESGIYRSSSGVGLGDAEGDMVGNGQLLEERGRRSVPVVYTTGGFETYAEFSVI